MAPLLFLRRPHRVNHGERAEQKNPRVGEANGGVQLLATRHEGFRVKGPVIYIGGKNTAKEHHFLAKE